MKWFMVKYIYQIVCSEGNYNTQFDEQFRLMQAPDINDAFRKAENQADGFQLPFKNCIGELVTWKFICVADIHEVQIPADGVEVTSILHEPEDITAFLNAIEQRKLFLQQQIQCENKNQDRNT
ncbi:DUF4288 domain-containing protein [Pedobacter sp. N23S346]|uniref:DUF4288 domain-containing protein n=1 Tax=Pedobacter sp. N23S346 TaxID=3402750 RepID=UPI003AC78EEA